MIIDVTLVWNNIGWTIYDDTYTTEKNVFWLNTDIVQVKYSHCPFTFHLFQDELLHCTLWNGKFKQSNIDANNVYTST